MHRESFTFFLRKLDDETKKVAYRAGCVFTFFCAGILQKIKSRTMAEPSPAACPEEGKIETKVSASLFELFSFIQGHRWLPAARILISHVFCLLHFLRPQKRNGKTPLHCLAT